MDRSLITKYNHNKVDRQRVEVQRESGRQTVSQTIKVDVVQTDKVDGV